MTQKQLNNLNLVLAVILLVSGIVIWTTGSGVAIAVFAIALVLGGLNITGVIGSLFGKDEELPN